MTTETVVDMCMFLFYGLVVFALYWDATSNNPDSKHYKHRKK